jgi:hypothetical protein
MTGEAREGWPVRHFSLANPLADRPGDLPHLLRRLAEAIEAHAIVPEDLMDVTVSQEVTDQGPSWSATVYWSPDPH